MMIDFCTTGGTNTSTTTIVYSIGRHINDDDGIVIVSSIGTRQWCVICFSFLTCCTVQPPYFTWNMLRFYHIWFFFALDFFVVIVVSHDDEEEEKDGDINPNTKAALVYVYIVLPLDMMHYYSF